MVIYIGRQIDRYIDRYQNGLVIQSFYLDKDCRFDVVMINTILSFRCVIGIVYRYRYRYRLSQGGG